MTTYKLRHHQIIESALKQFNAEFLYESNIIFGGGTRIALEIEEYRESVDIDFFCPDTKAYRAVRTQVTNKTLGDLVTKDFNYIRDIRADRDAVRTVIECDDTKIKLEFVSFSDYQIKQVFDNKLPVPYLDHASCFSTKLLANADRYYNTPYKDIFDLIAMYLKWGEIPDTAWKEADRNYGEKVVKTALLKALQAILSGKNHYFLQAKSIKMKDEWADRIINIGAEEMYNLYS